MARYSPGLDWLLPGNWLTGAPIKNLYDQAKKDHKWRLAYNDLEKDFPSDGSKRDPKANERLRNKIKADELLLKSEKNNTDANASEALKDAVKVINSSSSGDLGPKKSIGETNARASWLKATSNSPAAKAGFSDNERWNLQQQHREWKAARSPEVERQADATKGVTYWDKQAGAPAVGFNTEFKNPLYHNLPKGTDLGGLNIDYNTPPKGWDAGAAFKQDSAAGLSGADMAAGLGKVMQMLDPKGGKEWTEPIAKVNTSNKGRIDYDPFAWNYYSV